MSKFIDISNQKFSTPLGDIEVKELVEITEGNYRSIWKCICHCGKEFKAIGSYIKSGHTQSCGCSHFRKNKNSPNWKGVGEISATFYKQLCRGHYNRGKKKEVNISLEYLWNLFLKQNRKCKFTGIELEFANQVKRGVRPTASLDRIDSDKFYDEGNVQWIHKQVNIMKNNLSDQEFIEWCCKVADHYRNNNKEK